MTLNNQDFIFSSRVDLRDLDADFGIGKDLPDLVLHDRATFFPLPEIVSSVAHVCFRVASRVLRTLKET